MKREVIFCFNYNLNYKKNMLAYLFMYSAAPTFNKIHGSLCSPVRFEQKLDIIERANLQFQFNFFPGDANRLENI